ncbi:MAG: D-alanine--D-alanine ligase [Thermodesulfobacteriota bacterium]|nr:D-alanine--D-alanine ligase [Thermodesulfobacteriota bacterium]
MQRTEKLSIGVVCGGPSAEAEVSRVSGRNVANALLATYTNVTIFELDRNIGKALTKAKIDVVFPVLHGPPGEDGTFQGFLEIMQIPYVGSGVHASSCAMDKIVAKQIFRAYGLPVAQDVVICRNEGTSTAVERVTNALGLSIVVKPSRQGSALGVFLKDEVKVIEEAIDQAFQYDERVLIEKYIKGKEITVAILDQGREEALPIIEILTPDGSWYDYKHRYTPGLSEHLIPAQLPVDQYHRTREIAVMAHKALRCRDLSRVDFIVPVQGDPIVLEVNTIPGMTPTSLYPEAAQAAGISFEELVAYLVDLAFKRST